MVAVTSFPMLAKDVRYALRGMRRAPLFTVTVGLTVALAIGATTTIFGIVNAVILHPLPFHDPGTLVQVAEKNDKLSLPSFGASVLNFLSWREQAQSFSDIGAVGFNNYTLSGAGEPEQLSGNRISPALIRALGVAPVAGRAFTDDEEKPNAAPVAMIGEGLWKRRFGRDPSLVGRTITLNDTPTTVIGIAPAALSLISQGDVYTPLTIDRAKEIRLNHVILVFARLKPGVTMAQAQAEMNTIFTRMAQQYPEIRDWGIRLITAFDTFVAPELKTGLLVLLGAVLFVLLIACANIANLLLARAAKRQNEMAVRMAVGASRRQLVIQLLVESVLLSFSGGIAGALLAFGATHIINRTLPPNTLPVSVIEMDAGVLWFALGATVLTGLLFGIAPALRTARVDLNEVLKHGGRGSSGSLGARLRNALAVVEIALATVLLIGAGLFIQSLSHLMRVHLGFDSHGLITFQLAPPTEKYPVTSKAPQLYRALLESLQSIPGVQNAAVSSGLPFGAGNYTTHPIFTTDRSNLPSDAAVPVNWRIISPGYFRTMNIPLLRGRDFTEADGPNAPKVLIVSQATAKKFWGDADPLGHTLRRTADRNTPFTIVGVVGDVRDTALNQQSPALYYPMGPRVAALMDVAVRTAGSPDALLSAIRQKVHELDAELALANVRTEDDWVSNSAAQPRLNTVLLSIFAAVALLIATIGIYGVLAYSVAQRTAEIGMRMALGATPGGVLRMVVFEGMKLALIAIACGLLGGLAVGRALSSIIFGVAVRDPLTFSGVALTMIVIAIGACAIPAFRASRVDPMVALRYE
jgi:putative ABC transport system permease protein